MFDILHIICSLPSRGFVKSIATFILLWLLRSSIAVMELVCEEFDIKDKIYCGSQRIYFKIVPGEVIEFNSTQWIQTKTLEVFTELKLRSKLQRIENIDLPVIVPEIPAYEFIPINELTYLSSKNYPKIFMTPLIKCPADDPGVVISGLASGVRSGLIKIHNDWYRLKGCGNHDQGFILRKRIHPPSCSGDQSDWCDIRGCAFLNTTIRELYYSEFFSKIPSIVSANSSVGYMKYSDPSQLPCGASVPTTCILEKTIGDRRFGTHVLAGLELLLPYLIAEDCMSEENLLSFFPSRRPDKELNDLSKIVPTGPFISDYTLGTSQSGHDRDSKGLCWPEIPRDKSSLANMANDNRAIPLKLPSSYPPQWTREGPREMSPDWRMIWDNVVLKLQHILKSTGQQDDTHHNPTNDHHLSLLLNYLFSRCGFDCGSILSKMHSNRISWGTYQDSMCRIDFDEWHCNAHVNNLVVIPPHLSHSTHSILSFLDVDMAYGEEEMIILDPVNVPSQSLSQVFDHILWREYVNMMEVLAGNDCSTGVPNAALHITESYSPLLKGIQSTLYDTMILAYQEAYRNGLAAGSSTCPSPNPPPVTTTPLDSTTAIMEYNDILHQGAYCLIELSIIIMCDYIA